MCTNEQKSTPPPKKNDFFLVCQNSSDHSSMDMNADRQFGGSARSSTATILARQRTIVTREYENLSDANKLPEKPMWSDLSQQEKLTICFWTCKSRA